MTEKVVKVLFDELTRNVWGMFVHAADTPANMDIGVAEITDWHVWPKFDKRSGQYKYKGSWYSDKGDLPDDVKAYAGKGRGWDDIGYHFVIRRDGSVEVGRNINVTGAHCYGKNTGTIGICMVGRGDNYTEAQYDSLRALALMGIHKNPEMKFHGHYEFDDDKPDCPGFKVPEWIKENVLGLLDN